MICPTCQKPAEWVSHEVIYGKIYDPKAHMIWLCRDCMSWVGCHENTERPKGTMADGATRKWRIRAHAAMKGTLMQHTCTNCGRHVEALKNRPLLGFCAWCRLIFAAKIPQ